MITPHKSVNTEIIQELDPGFGTHVKEVVNVCESRGVRLLLLEGLRNPFKQALYWLGSRSAHEIQSTIQNLQDIDADFIAYCLFVVGTPKKSVHVTNALPGNSWHQYGMAVDCAWLVDAKPCWDTELRVNGVNGYDVLADACNEIGIQSGHHWTNPRDSGHLQIQQDRSPEKYYGWNYINAIMEEKFSELLNFK